jgi:cell division protein FtsL
MQKILCLALLVVSALVFIYSLGIMTDLYDALYSTIRSAKNLDKSSVTGSRVYYDMQDFNKLFLRLSIAMILLCVTLFVTNTHNRRKYYIGNYCSIALVSAGGIAFAIWAHGQIELYKAQFLNINFEELAEHAAKRKTLYTESTFWFDIHYLLFGLLVVGIVLLIANAIWKRKLMKEEQALIAGGKEAAA